MVPITPVGQPIRIAASVSIIRDREVAILALDAQYNSSILRTSRIDQVHKNANAG
jgi:hypothetical protein